MQNPIRNPIPETVRSIGIVGHVHPDGDCVGSTTALWRYLRDAYPEKRIDLYLEPVVGYLRFLTDDIDVRNDDGENESYDLVIACDVSSMERVGAGKTAFLDAADTFAFDHHETHTYFAKGEEVYSEASSACEVLMKFMDPERITLPIANALYTGIVHDTGVFRFACTSPETLRDAAVLIERGADFVTIIRDSVSEENLNVVKLTSDVILNGSFYPEEKMFVSFCGRPMWERYHLTPSELGSVVMNMNTVRESDVTVFFYENTDGTWKGSLRSKRDINVAEIAAVFGGGGHRRAAGFSIDKDPEAAAEKIRGIVSELRR